MSVLRSLFGPSKDEIWRQFSAAVGGQFSECGFCQGGRVDARHAEWLVTLDTYTVSTGKSSIVYTRMRAPYMNPDRFRFHLYRKSFLSNLGKKLGMQDVDVGYPDFDEPLIIQGNDEARLRRLFANAKIRALISAQPDIAFSVKDDEQRFWGSQGFPPDVDELYFQVAGVIKDPNRLRQLYDLFSETLDELCRMGSAYKKDPGIRL